MYTYARVLLPINPGIRETVRVSTPIVTLKHRVSTLIQNNWQKAIKYVKAIGTSKNSNPDDKSNDIATILAPVAIRKLVQKLLLVGPQVHHSPPRPILRITPSSVQDALLSDAHLVLNQSVPKVFLQTLKNPGIQHKFVFSQKLNKNELSCEAYMTGKIKSSPHMRKTHDCVPGQTISSAVAGPMSFGDQRLDKTYFVTGIYTYSCYAFTLNRRTEVRQFDDRTIFHFIKVFGKPPLVLVSDNTNAHVAGDMNKLVNSYYMQQKSTTPYNARENSVAVRLIQNLMNLIRC